MEVLKDIQLTKNFRLSEFKCRDGNQILIDDIKDIHTLQKMRDILQKSIFVLSAYRNEEYNAQVGGVPNSQHILGKAYDITCEESHFPLLIDLALKNFNAVGIYDDFVHVDSRNYKAFWNESKKYKEWKR